MSDDASPIELPVPIPTGRLLNDSEKNPPWVLLHGFTGQPNVWVSVGEQLDHFAYALALPGHCPALPVDADEPFESTVVPFMMTMQYLRRSHLVGYSLGGRLALGLASRLPGAIESLTLIGAHPGLDDSAERDQRRTSDQAWADRLRKEGLDAFFKAWEAQPIFASQRELLEDVRETQARLRRMHDKETLANALTSMSLADMPSYWDVLGRLSCPITYIAGEKDDKFVAIGRRIKEQHDHVRLEIVEGAGHNVVLEAPDALAALLNTITKSAPTP